MSDFDSFIKKLGRETIDNINKEKTERKESLQKKNKNRNIEDEKINENVESKNYIEEEDVEEHELNEEFIETALEYASVVLKTVRKTFDSQAKRIKIYEAIRNAIDLYLGPKVDNSLINNLQLNNSLPNNSLANNSLANNLQSSKKNNTSKKINEEYKRSMNIFIKDKNGKKEVDLSHITENDINDFKVLAGVINE